MEPDEIDAQTRAAFDEYMTDEERGVVAEPEEEETVEDETEESTEEEEGDAEAAETEDEEDTEDVSEEEEPERDIEVQAFLAKYDGDVDQALKAAAELYHVVGRQGSEKKAALDRVTELEAQLNRLQTFATVQTPLTEEQRDWVEEAASSDNPPGYVQMAVDAGEFDLARALCEAWAQEQPYQAARLGSRIDELEAQAHNAQQPEQVWNMTEMLQVAQQHFPDMPAYEQQMIRVMAQLGDDHHLVIAARSDDVNEAARGIVDIYEMAKATSVNVRRAKDKVRATKRQEGVDEREKAQVTSASTSTPAGEQTPRQQQIMPGLTLEELEAEFARS